MNDKTTQQPEGADEKAQQPASEKKKQQPESAEKTTQQPEGAGNKTTQAEAGDKKVAEKQAPQPESAKKTAQQPASADKPHQPAVADEKAPQPEVADDRAPEPEVAEEERPKVAKRKLRKRTIGIAAAVLVGVVIVAGAAYGLYEVLRSDSETAGTVTPDTGVVLPQNPSLLMVVEDGTLYVENDGNVTMSDIEVRDEAGTVICDMGVISPGDRQACDEAGGAEDLTAFGSGPQGQAVEVGLE